MLTEVIYMGNDKLVVKPKRPKGEDGYKVFSVRLKEESVSRVDQIALQTGRSRNELIGLFVDFALDNCTIEDNK